MGDLVYLNQLRQIEMEQLLALIPTGARVLEFGSGTGQQARFLADRGFDVVAIDLARSVYAADRIFPVQDYDGRHIPLEDASVDVIFSSNVLEHVEDLPTILGEFRRILKPGGTAIHVMPTSAWRFWTFVTGIADATKTAGTLPVHLVRPADGDKRPAALKRDVRRIARGLVPSGHGTSIEGISELWTFSAAAWRRKFRKNGFEVVEDRPTRVFYSGTVLFGLRVPFAVRRRLSRFLGSSMHLYVTRPVGRS
jgi:SAM-dependent methyltransferase